MLVRKMYERHAAERRQRVLEGANGIGIGMGGPEVYEKWLAAQAAPTAPAAENPRALAQLGTVMRLQSLFASQPKGSALHGAIKFRKPD